MTRYGWIPSFLFQSLLTGHEHVHAVCRSAQTRSWTPGEERITLNELGARTTAGRSQRYTGKSASDLPGQFDASGLGRRPRLETTRVRFYRRPPDTADSGRRASTSTPR